MITPEEIVNMLGRARSHDAKAASLYWQAKQSECEDERSYYFDQEREEADAARCLRATAWALVQADPTLKPPGVEVPEVYMPGA